MLYLRTVWAFVDQIANKDQLITALIIPNLHQEFCQLDRTAMHVANHN